MQRTFPGALAEPHVGPKLGVYCATGLGRIQEAPSHPY